jgi:hypothetical protein
MTDQFVVDIASYQKGYRVAQSTAAAVFAKATEGSTYVNPEYVGYPATASAPAFEGWQAEAIANTAKPFGWYHFLSSAPAADQVANTKRHVDARFVGMVDIEPEGKFKPTLAEAFAYIDAAKAAGLTVRFAYLPRWHWIQLGKPDLSGFTERGVHLISSAYPGGSGSPADIYVAGKGDAGEGWAEYGNVTPTLWQFTNAATDQGMKVDYSAFKGDAGALAALFEVKPVLSGGDPPKAPVTPPPAHSNARVVVLQEVLNERGAGLLVDGVKGQRTDTALKNALAGTNLKQGATGYQVRVLQAALDVFGAGIATDSDFGPKTETAVKDFQAAHGLKADGQAGPDTDAKLTALAA